MPDPRPIGVFDSGVGGLTVLREIVRRLPGESTIYLGDNARTPYGTRPDDEVLAFSSESVEALVARDVKAVVIACNTSTAVALPHLRRRYELPILGVNGLEAPPASPVHRQLTTGDVAGFRALATRLFGEEFTDVAAVELNPADNEGGTPRASALGAAATTGTGGKR